MTGINGHGKGRTRPELVLIAVSLLLILIYLALSPFNIADSMSPWLDTDYGMLTNNGLRILKGDLLYRDIWSFYTPAASYVVAGLFKVFGVNLRTLRIALAFTGAFTAFLSFYFARSLTSTLCALAVAAFAVLLGPVCVNYPYPSWFCIPLGLFMVLIEHIGWRKNRNAYHLAAGALAGMIFSFKVNCGLLAFAALVCIQSFVWVFPPENIPTHQRAHGKATPVPFIALLVLVPVGSMILMRNHLTLPNFFVFSVPAFFVTVLGLVLLMRRMRKGTGVTLFFSPMVLSAVGFVSVVLPWTIFFLVRLGAAGFYQAMVYPLSFFSRIAYHALPAPTIISSLLALVCIFQGIMIFRKGASVYVKTGFLLVLGAFELFLVYKMIPFLKEGLLGTSTSLYSKWGFGLASYVPLAVHIGIVFVLLQDFKDIEKAGRDRVHMLMSLWIYSVLAFHAFYPLMEPHHLIWNMSPVIILGGVFLLRSTKFWKTNIYPVYGQTVITFGSALIIPVFLGLFLGLPFFSYFVKIKASPFQVGVAEFSDIETPRSGILMPLPLASSMNETVQYITSHTKPNEYIFDATGSIFYFLTDRPNPTRWGHFVEGFLSSQDVAEIMRKLEALSPKVAVISYAADIHLSLNDPDLYAYIRARYKPVKTFGDYQVLVLNEAER